MPPHGPLRWFLAHCDSGQTYAISGSEQSPQSWQLKSETLAACSSACAACSLVDRCAPQFRELREDVRHNALTTCGVTRWNASAYRIAESPDERRAWLARCSARCV